MKKFTKFYSIFFFAVLLSCQKSEEKLDPQASKCLITQMETYEGNTLYSTDIYEYDENKNLLKITYKNKNNEVFIVNYKNEYDSNKDLIKTTKTDQDGKLVSVSDLTYFSKGKIKTQTEQNYISGNSKVTTEYNLGGKEVYLLSKNSNSLFERKSSYDSKNNLIYEETIQNGQVQRIVMNTYNENNRILKSVYKGSSNSSTENTYDSDGQLLKTIDDTGLETTYTTNSDKTIRESESKRNGVYVSSLRSELIPNGQIKKAFQSFNRNDYFLIADYTFHQNSVPKTQKIYEFKKDSKTEVFMTYDIIYDEKGNALNAKFFDRNTYLLSYAYVNKFNCN